MSDVVSEKLFELENDENLLSFKTHDGLPIYLMAKSHLVYENVMPLVMDMKLAEDDRRINVEAVRFLTKAAIHNVLERGKHNKSEIAIYVPSRPVIIDGQWVNRYSDLFADEYKDKTFTIEQTAKDWQWPFPRRNDRVIFDGVMNAFSSIRGRVFKSKDIGEIKRFLLYYNDRLYKLFGKNFTDAVVDQLILNIGRIIEQAKYRAKWLDKQLPKETKLLIMIGAAYPGSYPITKRIKERGIRVADLQHGFITKTNAVYSYADALLNSKEAIDGSADYFLTYGDWWNDQIINPSVKVSIGNPYRDYSVERVKVDLTNRILIIGCGINTEKRIQMAELLEKEVPGYSVVFRPHPGEIEMAKSIIAEKGYAVKLDDIKEVYESLAITKVVISEMSTVLFEAIGICNDIIILDTDYSRHNLPENPFIKCRSDTELVAAIEQSIHGESSVNYNIDDIWKAQWSDNYRNFLSSINIDTDA